MICTNCREADLTHMGCRITGNPLYWCPNCGAMKPCDGELVVPASWKWRVPDIKADLRSYLEIMSRPHYTLSELNTRRPLG